MEVVHHLQGNLEIIVSFLEVVLEAVAAFCIVLGLLVSIKLSVNLRRRRSTIQFPLGRLRLTFGRWLALALEFQLGADVLATTVAPTFEALGKLGAIAIIRTFLNYFLNKELIEVFEMQKRFDEDETDLSNSN
ncbi:DUF1622 domain-containing protein [Acaryochloris marina]|uniref:Membrane protein, putative n=1 Tax=Acaryochloris marina (strain MBIC 11017) TaxID=329726 RepID=A8ZPK7_ACAM1|nr:DUF1622 domain-containing protein [Acaryochloris marina]ABW31095.1 hypothetical protein AM1_6163 [Acaryochloris marina MBIC11017]ABW32943.1 membrane protein, putative [Acaryochloris marina MBIC11017]BDM79805.1 membrane protein [Acaryochloris marina MBIC10699]